MELRDYQKNIKNHIYQSWNNNKKNIMIQLPTGSGKTVIFTDIIAESKLNTVVIAHRLELVGQISLTLAKYGIKHNLIAQKTAIRKIIALHMSDLGKNFINPHSCCFVAAVDTLIRLSENTEWFKKIQLVIQDEGHHVLKNNKWGKAAALFPNAYGLYPTATPVRADGYGLGIDSDGVIDELITGVGMRDLIDQKYLTDYTIYAPQSDIDMSLVNVTAAGDYSLPKLRAAVHKSKITGDIVEHYLKIAPGKLGITFTVDVDSAVAVAQEFRDRGVSSEVISSRTPDLLRLNIMQRFRKKEILQLVNVDLLGEGVDVPAVEVVSFARATQSYGLYVQQFGRALRPLQGKKKAIIIDHVGNCLRHGLPDAYKEWSLERRERRAKSNEKIVALKTCLECFIVYERIKNKCPQCGYFSIPQGRSTPEQVDGDLIELDESTLKILRGKISKIDNIPHVPSHLNQIIQKSIIKKHNKRFETQGVLRNLIAKWAGYYRVKEYQDSEIYKQFFFEFNIDIGTAQTLGSQVAKELIKKIENSIDIIDNNGIL